MGDFDTNNSQIQGSNLQGTKISASWRILKQFRNLRFLEDNNGDIWVFPTVITAPAPSGSSTAVAAVGTPPATGAASNAGLAIYSQNQISPDGVLFDWIRGGNIIMKTGSFTAAGDNSLWTPTAGKKFRLYGLALNWAGALAVAANDLIKVTDGAAGTAIFQVNPFLPATTPIAAASIMGSIVLPHNGFLSGAADRILTVNIQTAITAGSVTANAWGLEE